MADLYIPVLDGHRSRLATESGVNPGKGGGAPRFGGTIMWGGARDLRIQAVGYRRAWGRLQSEYSLKEDFPLDLHMVLIPCSAHY